MSPVPEQPGAMEYRKTNALTRQAEFAGFLDA
jgi:hypothetical protein